MARWEFSLTVDRRQKAPVFVQIVRAIVDDVKRAFADGDFVILHAHLKLQPEDLGLAIVDMFRVEHGKIVEHWDVRQPIPETAANTNGMF